MSRLAVLVSLALGACHATPATTCPEAVVESEPVQCAEAQRPAEPAADPVPEPVVEEDSDADEIAVVVGECDLRAVPEALREELSEEEAAELAERVRAWLAGAGSFRFAPRKGIAFAKSRDDEGRSPPFPSRSAAQGIHACGVSAGWLTASLRETFVSHGGLYANGPVTCQGSVCCYLALGEYDSGGGAVFARRGGRWDLRAAYQVADNGTLAPEYVTRANRTVRQHLSRLSRRRCDEPEDLANDW